MAAFPWDVEPGSRLIHLDQFHHGRSPFVLAWIYRGEDAQREKVKTEAKMAVAQQCGHKPRKPKNANHHQKLEEPWN